ncbi:MAG: hypothetical protein AB7N90_10390, partial [Vicinamibacterales bacterium]
MRLHALALAGAVLAATPVVAQAPADRLVPMTLTAEMLACADTPAIAPAPDAPRGVAAQAPDYRASYVRGDVLVLDAGTDAGLEPGQQYFVRRTLPAASGAPASPEHPGALRTAGWVTLTAVDAATALARVDTACAPIEPGDYLVPYAPPALPAALGPDGPPAFDRMAQVLFGTDRRQQFAVGDIFTIDQGSDAGLTAGTRLVFFRDRRNGTPLVEVGDGAVLAVAPHAATVVLSRQRDVVESGD